MDTMREELRARVLKLRGYIGPFQEAMIALDPEWVERYLAFVCAPNERISMRLTQLIYVAIDAVPSHLYPKGIDTHSELALKLGATREELIETLEIAASLTALSLEAALPILAEEAGIAQSSGSGDLAARFAPIAAEAPGWLPSASELAPKTGAALIDMIAHPWRRGALPPKERAFIALACNAAPAVLSIDGIRRHVREALAQGATKEEIADVICLASGIGVHSLAVGAPILAEVLKRNETAAAQAKPGG